jgi:hypothetical protein
VSPEQPLPLPEGETVLEVLDPAVEAPAVSADQAIALARALEGNWVGESPQIQLLRLAFRDPGSEFAPVWTGWVILSTDIPWRGTGGPYRESPIPYAPTAALTWVYVTVDGEVPGLTQVGGEEPYSVPPSPAE